MFGAFSGFMRSAMLSDAEVFDARRRRKIAEQQTLSPDEVDSFFDAAEVRPAVRNKKWYVDQLEKKNSYRMWRIRHDLKWLERQAKKLGLNPEEARWLL